LIYTGSLRQGYEELDQGWALYNGQRGQLRQAAFTHALQDPGVNCLVMAARPLSLLGSPDQALRRSQDAIALAQDLQHPFSLGFAYAMKAMVHHLRREAAAARENADAALALCQQHGFQHLLAVGTIWRGWALAEQGQCEEGIAQLRQGLAAFRATSAEIALPHYIGALVEACARAGQIEEGLLAVSKALGFVEKNNERFYEAELWRLRGELILQKFRASGSELQRKNCVRARVQRAKSKTTDS
jgi:predicted ATPase